MNESNAEKRAADAMLDAIRAEEPPALDWDAIEKSLLRRVRLGEGAKPAARAPSGAWRVLSFAAAAAIVPLALSLGASSPSTETVQATRPVDVASVASAPGEAGARGEHDLGALKSGDAIEAKDAAVTFADAGKVRWTLSHESRLVVRSPVPESGVGHVVQLERGSLRVEVEPDLVKNGLVDVLAVEVGNTRIAVHGTAFTVTLRGDEVLVDVEHGVVTVGPVGQRGATTGYQLPAGSRAAFSLDGGRRARWLRPNEAKPVEPVAAAHVPSHSATPGSADMAKPQAPPSDDVPAMMDPPPVRKTSATAVAANAPADTAKSADASEPVAVAAPEPPKQVMTATTVQSGLKRCFLQAHPPSEIDGPKLTATSTFTLKIRGNGTVEGAAFNPPLPSIQGCAAFVYAGKFAPGATSYTVSIPVQLSQ